jgi:predicted DNA-binding transcriptional regulator AlpA
LTIVKTPVGRLRLMDLMGAAEIAEYLGMSRQRVHQLAERDDFPRPVAVLSAGKFWLGADIREYAARRRANLEGEQG